MAWTWYIGVRTRGRSHLVVLMKRKCRLRRQGEDMISFRVKHSSLSHSMNSPRVESGMHTSAEASCCPWTWQRTWSPSPSCRSMESTVKGLPAPSVKFSKVILERLVKVKGRQDSRPTGLRLIISSTVLYGMASGITLNRPVRRQKVSMISGKNKISCSDKPCNNSDTPVWLMGSSNFSLLLMSSQWTERSSMPMTFTRSPVEKHTSLPEISYIDPETENERNKIHFH